MAETDLKLSVRLRWWVVPFICLSVIPALAVGGGRRDRFVNAVGNFVLRHGVSARAE